MSSADFRAFVQAELDECQRRADLYQGAQSDLGAPAEHFAIDHLERLLSMSISEELRTLYMAEYSDMRAAMRAIAVCGLTRKDFYDEASYVAIREQHFLRAEVASRTAAGSQFRRRLGADLQAQLADLDLEYETRKNEIIDRLHAAGGVPSSETLTDADVVREAMKDVPGVNARGVSTSIKRIF